MTQVRRFALSRGLALGVILTGTLSAGCSGSYFTELFQTSNIRIKSISEGSVTFDLTKIGGAFTADGKVSVVDPQVSFVAENNSQATTFTSAEVKFFTAEAQLTGTKVGASTMLTGADPTIQLVANVPFTSTIGGTFGDPGQVPVHCITSEVIAAIDPTKAGTVQPPTFFGTATLKGTNLMGQAVTVTVNLTIALKVNVTTTTTTVGG